MGCSTGLLSAGPQNAGMAAALIAVLLISAR